MRRRVLLLVNPAAASGRALAAVQRVTDSLRSHSFDCQRAHSAQGQHLTELARELAPSCDVLVAAGGGAMRLSPGARLDDGRLEFCLIQALSRLEALRCFPMLVRGTFPCHPKVRYFGGQELSVSADTPAPLALDGDVLARTPATFRVLAGALRVLAPT